MLLEVPDSMGVQSLQELYIYRLSVQFRRAVYTLIRESPGAQRDLRYRDQLLEATSSISANIAEGFSRRTTRDFYLFLSYARGSAAEAIDRIEDGADRGHFSIEALREVTSLGRRTAAAIGSMQRSLRPFMGPSRNPPSPAK